MERHHVAQPEAELHVPGLIQPELPFHGFDELAGDLAIGPGGGQEISGRQVHEQKNQERDADQHRYQDERPAQDEGDHSVASSVQNSSRFQVIEPSGGTATFRQSLRMPA